MGRKKPIFYNALMLTGVNLLLRLVGTSFQVFVSARIGAAGVGLLQLVMSVGSMTMTAGMAGIRTTAMYLTAEELGKNRAQNVTWVLSGCILYSLLCSGAVGAAVYLFAPQIAQGWIGDMRTLGAIRLLACFLPASCLSGVMTGYFTAANRITTLAIVEVVEQLCSMTVTTLALLFWAGDHIGRACQAVALGGSVGACFTLSCLVLLRLREKAKTGPKIPVARRLTGTAVPLALADDLKVGINTVENLMVPKRLALYSGAGNALAQFGTVCGMVFPVLMFPAAILYGLADILIPELARCNAAGSHRRIRYLARRSLRVALLYGIGCGGVMYMASEVLCLWLYKDATAGEYLQWFSLLVPMLYCDAVIDAMNKGLGQQKICVQFNILTAVMDVVGLYILLPIYGVWGYFISFFISHAVNAGLSLALLLKTTRLRIPLRVPLITVAVMLTAVAVASGIRNVAGKVACYLAVGYGLLYLFGILHREDLRWLGTLVRIPKNDEKIPDNLKNNV